MAAKIIDLTGAVFGFLTVTSRAEIKTTHRLASWNVICKCGRRLVCRSDELRSGAKTSCPERKLEYRKHKVLSVFAVIYDGSKLN
jgi:hypothetical protein